MEALITQPGPESAGFKGAAPNVANVLTAADILFHPSDRESLGLSVLEGILSGLPVVCSEAVSEVVGEGLVAASYSAGDPRSAAEAIEQVTKAYRKHAEQALDRREKALKSFGMTACALAYLQIFYDVLSSKPNSEGVP